MVIHSAHVYSFQKQKKRTNKFSISWGQRCLEQNCKNLFCVHNFKFLWSFINLWNVIFNMRKITSPKLGYFLDMGHMYSGVSLNILVTKEDIKFLILLPPHLTCPRSCALSYLVNGVLWIKTQGSLWDSESRQVLN